MFGEAIRREHVGKTRVRGVGVLIPGARAIQSDGICLALRIHGIGDGRFQRFVVRRERTVIQADGNPKPAETIRVQDVRFVAGKRGIAFRTGRRNVTWWFRRGEIGNVFARPFLGGLVPPD